MCLARSHARQFLVLCHLANTSTTHHNVSTPCRMCVRSHGILPHAHAATLLTWLPWYWHGLRTYHRPTGLDVIAERLPSETLLASTAITSQPPWCLVTVMSITRARKSVHRIAIPYRDGGIVFLYLLIGDSAALIDTGPAESLAVSLQPALAQLGIALSDIDLILNTHGHMDHAGGNLELKAASNAPIHLHRGDLPMAKSVDAQIELAIEAPRRLGFPDTVVKGLADKIMEMAGQPAGADRVLSDGDVVDLGDGMRLRALHSPGHTKGSVSYYWESEGALFTGDAVQGQGARVGVYPLYSDASDYRRTLSTLLRLEVRSLFLGHAFVGGGIINDPTRVGDDARAFVLDSVRVADTIHRAIARGVRQMPGASEREIVREALSELIYHVPQLLVRETGMPGWAGPTLVAHIQALAGGDYPSEDR